MANPRQPKNFLHHLPTPHCMLYEGHDFVLLAFVGTPKLAEDLVISITESSSSLLRNTKSSAFGVWVLLS
jgi:hypothetical protein